MPGAAEYPAAHRTEGHASPAVQFPTYPSGATVASHARRHPWNRNDTLTAEPFPPITVSQVAWGPLCPNGVAYPVAQITWVHFPPSGVAGHLDKKPVGAVVVASQPGAGETGRGVSGWAGLAGRPGLTSRPRGLPGLTLAGDKRFFSCAIFGGLGAPPSTGGEDRGSLGLGAGLGAGLGEFSGAGGLSRTVPDEACSPATGSPESCSGTAGLGPGLGGPRGSGLEGGLLGGLKGPSLGERGAVPLPGATGEALGALSSHPEKVTFDPCRLQTILGSAEATAA
eukprot:RCo039426